MQTAGFLGRMFGFSSLGPLAGVGHVLVLAVLAGLCLRVVARVRHGIGRSRAEAGAASRQVQDFIGGRRDALTGLQTRQAFGQSLARRLAAGQPYALLLIDIDGFGRLNACEGAGVGDEVLRLTAERLRALVQDQALVGRVGDDEFALLVETGHGAQTHDGMAVATRSALCRPVAAGGRMLSLTVSIGVALAPDHGQDAERLMQTASLALSQVKASGGGGWRAFDRSEDLEQRLRSQMMEELREAVASGEFVPWYQPIVELATGRVVGLEVLARWQSRRRGLLQPEVFIPLAEEMQLAGAISQALLRRVMRDARAWPSWFYFAFNASPGQLRGLVDLVHNRPDWPEAQFDPARIEVEITESALIEDMEVAREVVAELQARGTRVVLDDLGSGFSNLVHLRELPFDRIKIDRGFVTGMTDDPRAAACVRAMIALGRSLGIDTVAEGIETVDVAASLTAAGCRFGQGFLYSPPVPASAVPGLLRRSEPVLVTAAVA